MPAAPRRLLPASSLLRICVGLVWLLGACGGSSSVPTPTATAPASPSTTEQGGASHMMLQSTAFNDGEQIPSRYTCDGENVSPSLTWSGEPIHTAVFVLIVDDPDAPRGTFSHWVYYDLPADVHQIGEDVPANEHPDSGGIQGKNDFGKIGYGGPCPPQGSPHHYHFTLYALDTPLNLPPGASRQQVLDATQHHIIGQAGLVGVYQRK